MLFHVHIIFLYTIHVNISPISRLMLFPDLDCTYYVLRKTFLSHTTTTIVKLELHKKYS